jgi:hypothetical protein
MLDPDFLRMSVVQKLKPGIKFIHFVVNIRKSTNCPMKTTITNGNHWVYVVISFDGSHIFYGDQKGWYVPENLKACFDPLLELLKNKDEHTRTEITETHIPFLSKLSLLR